MSKDLLVDFIGALSESEDHRLIETAVSEALARQTSGDPLKISELFAVFDAHPELAHVAKKLQGFSRPDEGLAEVLRIG